ncbi:MAG: NfeD family protein [Bacillota bacterium]|nr:NfeD family protein [Bacillota bacterium]
MGLQLFWWVLGFLLSLLELLSGDFILLSLGIAALSAGVAASGGLSLPWTLATFSAVALLFLVSVRPFLRRLLYRKPYTPTNAEALIGATGYVTQAIGRETRGRVRVDGQDWAARAENDLPEGTPVRVLRFSGVTLWVEEVQGAAERKEGGTT